MIKHFGDIDVMRRLELLYSVLTYNVVTTIPT